MRREAGQVSLRNCIISYFDGSEGGVVRTLITAEPPLQENGYPEWDSNTSMPLQRATMVFDRKDLRDGDQLLFSNLTVREGSCGNIELPVRMSSGSF